MAIKHHPDKNRDDPHAEERFKEIAIAYQTLSDPELRRKYNEFGPKESAPEGGFVDPEEIFGTIFGGDRFVPIIGHISLAKDMKAALQEEGEEGEEVQRDAKGREILSPEEKARRDEKARKQAAEVCFSSSTACLGQDWSSRWLCTTESGGTGREGIEAGREPGPQDLDIHRVGDGSDRPASHGQLPDDMPARSGVRPTCNECLTFADTLFQRIEAGVVWRGSAERDRVRIRPESQTVLGFKPVVPRYGRVAA